MGVAGDRGLANAASMNAISAVGYICECGAFIRFSSKCEQGHARPRQPYVGAESARLSLVRIPGTIVGSTIEEIQAAESARDLADEVGYGWSAPACRPLPLEGAS